MSPLRILILAILFYLAYRLIVGGNRKVSQGARRKEEKTMPLDDILEEDPVCGKLVPRQQAIVLEDTEKKKYFCSQECCDRYRTEQGESQ